MADPVLPAALQLFQQRERFPEQHQRLSLGCPVLDQFLGGGLPLEGITDLAGCSSAGKTQLALQLCLTVQFPRQYGGLEAGEWLPLSGSVGKSWSKASGTQAPCSGLLSSQGGIAVSWVVSHDCLSSSRRLVEGEAVLRLWGGSKGTS